MISPRATEVVYSFREMLRLESKMARRQAQRLMLALALAREALAIYRALAGWRTPTTRRRTTTSCARAAPSRATPSRG